MYLPILSISTPPSQLLPTFVDINLQWENKESDSDRLIPYDKIGWSMNGIKVFLYFGFGPF